MSQDMDQLVPGTVPAGPVASVPTVSGRDELEVVVGREEDAGAGLVYLDRRMLDRGIVEIGTELTADAAQALAHALTEAAALAKSSGAPSA